MLDVRLRNEGSQFGVVNGGSTNTEHIMAKGAESAEKVEKGVGEPIGTGKERMHKLLLRVRATKLRA